MDFIQYFITIIFPAAGHSGNPNATAPMNQRFGRRGFHVTQGMSGCLVILAISLSSTAGIAQMGHTFHKTYDMKEVERVEIELMGDLEFIQWRGKQLMVETSVKLGNAASGMLRHVIKGRRYDIAKSSQDATLRIESVDKERKALITQAGECDEEVRVVVYVPSEFDVVNDNLLEKIAPPGD